MDPIDRLLEEHVQLLQEIDRLRAAADDLRTRGSDAVVEVLPTLRDFGQVMASSLALHAAKEDDVLFPPLEEVLGTGGPTAVMRQEHVEIHGYGSVLRQTLDELEADHPVIEEKGEFLRGLDGDGSGLDAGELSRHLDELITLIDGHFQKEEQILFPMARQILDRDVLDEIDAGMVALEEERAVRA